MSRSSTGRSERDRSQPSSRNRAAKQQPRGGSTGARRGARSGRAASSTAGRARTRAQRSAPSRRWRRWVLLALLGVLTAVVVVAYFTPVLGVRTVRVSGNTTLSDGELLGAAQVRTGEPMLRLDTGEIRSRLRKVSEVATAEVKLSWPSTVTLAVTERVPSAYVAGSGEFRIFDAFGIPFDRRQRVPAELPELRVPSRAPGPDDPATRAAMTALRSLPPEVRDQTVAVIARSPGDIHLRLDGDRRVRWGGPEESARKAAVLPPLLTRPGTVYDVITPALPTVS